MNRRDLLKLFGAGATAVPLIGGRPEMDAAAKLVEPAVVEPVGASSGGSVTVHGAGAFEITVQMVSKVDGRRIELKADSVVTSLHRESRYAGYGLHQLMLPGPAALKWTLQGEARTPDEHGNLAYITTYL